MSEHDVQVRPAGPEDEDFLFELFRSVREPSLRLGGLPDAMIESLLRAQYAGRRLSYREQYPQADYGVLLRDGKRVGATVVARTHEAIIVVDVVVAPDRRGQGLGTTWLRSCLSEAAAAAVPVRLQVDRENAGALRLYERFGFRESSRSDTHVAMTWPGDA